MKALLKTRAFKDNHFKLLLNYLLQFRNLAYVISYTPFENTLKISAKLCTPLQHRSISYHILHSLNKRAIPPANDEIQTRNTTS